MPKIEPLRNGHVVAKCGVATLEYLTDYARRRGMASGSPTTDGARQFGKFVCLMVVGDQLVRADFDKDVKGNRKLRRLSATRFLMSVDARFPAAGLPKTKPLPRSPLAEQLARA